MSTETQAATESTTRTTPLVEVRDARMEFPGVVALDGVSFDLRPGECHALVGENGAGKSTLAKAIIGEYTLTSGEILIGGEPTPRHYDVRESQRLGIAVVHQEFQLMEELTALENIYMGHYAKRGPFIDRQAQRTRARELLDYLGVNIHLDVPVKYLRTAEKQLVQLARALSREAQVIVLDELTAVLPENDIENIFRIVRLLRDDGKGIIYVSHRLDEIFEVCDRYTVLMDGRHVQTGDVSDLTKPKLVELIAGRELSQVFPPINEPDEEIVLEVEGLTSDAFSDVDLQVRRGEVVGIAGLVGAGKTELLRAIFGDYKVRSGSIRVNGKGVAMSSPRKAIHHGLGFVPDERKRLGLNGALDVRKNTTLPSMSKFKKWGVFMDDRAELEHSYETLESLRLRYSSLWQSTAKLSGGNQQKIVIAKWLIADTDIFLMDEPTRGIDVGAKSEIYKLITALTAQGKSVVIVSPEIEELLGLANRIYVLYEGKVRDVFEGERKNQSEIMTSLLGVEK
ncbi:sugar ABC transporter ATP-binding protein [Tessaracoccus sp. OS52]|uniref:sugar ABC transporter ATP-binding protein n=1 Tax=Tessaracoccus sp. OS52 TaxID=2886691 RepID=UPI001D0F9F90|nr:sugar ABC transporter ATP-binding protein [Tessaracoccus sp. OS52]MCC2594271.1 sugar ABC transporter ATP-binding protein [Tessaracoccus sp. OS52]